MEIQVVITAGILLRVFPYTSSSGKPKQICLAKRPEELLRLNATLRQQQLDVTVGTLLGRRFFDGSVLWPKRSQAHATGGFMVYGFIWTLELLGIFKIRSSSYL